MPGSKEVHKEGGSQTEGSQNTTSSPESGTWETIPLKEIKEILPAHLVDEIVSLVRWDELKHRAITDRWRNAYKYHVWHEETFINGIHKGSKYRQFIKEVK